MAAVHRLVLSGRGAAARGVTTRAQAAARGRTARGRRFARWWPSSRDRLGAARGDAVPDERGRPLRAAARSASSSSRRATGCRCGCSRSAPAPASTCASTTTATAVAAPRGGRPRARSTSPGCGSRLPRTCRDALRVVERRGCDRRPIDIASAEGRLQLESSLWADQVTRLGRLRGAFEVAAREPASVEHASVDDVAARVLAEPRAGVTTVVYHAIVYEYFIGRRATARSTRRSTSAGARRHARRPARLAALRGHARHARLRRDAHHLAGRRGARGRHRRRARLRRPASRS